MSYWRCRVGEGLSAHIHQHIQDTQATPSNNIQRNAYLHNTCTRLVAKHWLIIGFERKISQSGLVDRKNLPGGGGLRSPPPPDSPPPAGYEGLRPSNSPWIGFQNPASINQSRLVDLVPDWLMRAASTSKALSTSA